MGKKLFKFMLSVLIAVMAVAGMVACAGGPANGGTNVQEVGVDEGDIIKISEDGTIFTLQSDGVVVTKPQNGTPYIVDYHEETYENCIPLEMYVADDKLITIVGLYVGSDGMFYGDYKNFRSAEYGTVQVTIYDISYLKSTETTGHLLNTKTIYNFNARARLIESRVLDNSMYMFLKYDDVYSPAIDSDGKIVGMPKGEWAGLTVDDTLNVEVRGASYSDVNSYKTIDRALYIEPTNRTTNTNTLTACFKIDLGGAKEGDRPRITLTNALYGSELQTVYMSETDVFCAFSAIKDNRAACGRWVENNLIITRLGLELQLKAKVFISNTVVPSRYAFKQYGEYFFATIEQGNYVYISSFNKNLKQLDKELLCYNEDLKAVNYDSDEQGKQYCYAVTFRQVDPLYKADISNPTDIQVKSELSITGYSVYLHKFPPDYTVGIGYEATESGTITGAKVTLFNTRSDVTEEVNSIVIPDVDYAEILEDPRAFCVHNEYIVFGFSARRSEKVNGVTRYKQGFYMFGVKDGRLVDIAYVSNFENGVVGTEQAFYDYSTYRKSINRASIIGEYVYTIADGMIVSYPIQALIQGDKTPYYTLKTDMYTILGGNEYTPPERQDGIFWEG